MQPAWILDDTIVAVASLTSRLEVIQHRRRGAPAITGYHRSNNSDERWQKMK